MSEVPGRLRFHTAEAYRLYWELADVAFSGAVIEQAKVPVTGKTDPTGENALDPNKAELRASLARAEAVMAQIDQAAAVVHRSLQALANRTASELPNMGLTRWTLEDAEKAEREARRRVAAEGRAVDHQRRRAGAR
jgi:hypothetical protein